MITSFSWETRVRRVDDMGDGENVNLFNSSKAGNQIIRRLNNQMAAKSMTDYRLC